jgi:hypothetical protein
LGNATAATAIVAADAKAISLLFMSDLISIGSHSKEMFEDLNW